MNDDLLQLTFSTAETTTLDFKGPTTFAGADRAEVAELLKDIAALANRDGGDLVIGVAQRPSGFDRVGLTDMEAQSFDATRTPNTLGKYVDPPLRFTVHQLRDTDGKRFVILRVEGFSAVPHICKVVADGTGQLIPAGTIFIRNDACESKAVTTSEEMRVLLDRMLRRNSDYLIERMQSAMSAGLRIVGGEAPAETYSTSRAVFAERAPRTGG